MILILHSVCLVSLIRIVTITRMDFEDVTWKFAVLAYWGAVEVNLAIICACLMTLKPLVVRVWPTLLASTARHETYGEKPAEKKKQVSVGGSSTGTNGGEEEGPTVLGDEEEGHIFTRLDDSDKGGGFDEKTVELKSYELGHARGVPMGESKAHEDVGTSLSLLAGAAFNERDTVNDILRRTM